MRNWICLFAALCAVSSARAAPALEVYGRLPAIDHVELSPSGGEFGLVAREGENHRLFVRKADGAVLVSAPLGESKVRNLRWVGDDHLLVFASATIYAPVYGFPRQEWVGAAALHLRDSSTMILFNKSETYLQAVFGWYGQAKVDDHWYGYLGAVTYEQVRPRVDPQPVQPNLYRMNMDTGEVTLVALATAGDTSWVLGADGQVAARGAYDFRGRTFKLTSGAHSGSPLIVSRSADGQGDLDLGGPGRTSDSVVIFERTDDDVLIREVPLSGDTQGEVLSRGDNTAEPIYDRVTGLLIGLSEESGARVRMYDPALQRRVDAARKAFPGLITQLVSFDAKFDRMVFRTEGKGDAGTYWLVDIAGRSARRIGYINPAIKEADVGDVRVVRYKAADGLALDGVLTLPPDREARNLPLVVLPHGGPLVPGDQPGFDWWAQAFASRGYAVFQPNYRGTLGYGEGFRRAAFGEFGRKMQTDISDGVAALVAEGVVDPKRACIVGGSYGGYAALAGVTLQHGLYRCAVSVAGVADLQRMFSWVAQRAGPDRRSLSFWRALSGAAAGQDLSEISPARVADKADAPILLIHGVDDTVVPIEQSKQMEKALKSAGKSVEFVTMKGEDHWLSKESTRQVMLSSAVAFVEKNNPAH